MKTFNEGKGTCDSCFLAIDAPDGGYICMEQIGKSLFEMAGCPGAITDKIVLKAQAAVLKARPAVGPEQLAKTKAELDQLLSEAKLLVLQLKSAKLQMEDEPPQANERRMEWQDLSKGGFVNAEKEQTLGTIAEPADPPPASELPPDKTKNKIRVKMVMNFDLIADYFCLAARLREEEWYLVGEPAGFSRVRAERKANELREKKSSLEAKIMEKLMAE